MNKYKIDNRETNTLDYPWQKGGPDYLATGEQAKELVKYIKKNSSNRGSYNVGIEVSWGVGKTSFINMMCETIKDSGQSVIVHFSPWANLNEKPYHVAVTLINEMITELESSKNHKMIQGLCKRLKECAPLRKKGLGELCKNLLLQSCSEGIVSHKISLARSLLITPLIFVISYLCINYLWIEDASVAQEVSKIFSPVKVASYIATCFGIFCITQYAETKTFIALLSYNATKKELRGLLEEQNKKIFIFVDDLDRMEGDKISKILMLTKEMFDLPYFHFILCYDRDVLEQKLNLGKFERCYLEKFIQLHYNIPSPDKELVRKFFIKCLRPECNIENNDFPCDDSDQKIKDDPSDVCNIKRCVLNMITDLRQAKKIIADSKDIIRILGKEINPLDLIATSTIKTIHPKWHDAILENIIPFVPHHNLSLQRDSAFDCQLHEKKLEKYLEDRQMPNLLFMSENIPQYSCYLSSLLNLLFPCNIYNGGNVTPKRLEPKKHINKELNIYMYRDRKTDVSEKEIKKEMEKETRVSIAA